MSYGSDVVDVALAEVGVSESPANSNLQKYGKWYGINGVAWCVIFVEWCYAQAKHTLPYKTASCSELLNWYKKNRPQLVVTDPSPGDIVIYNLGQGHAGIYERPISGDWFFSLEGNTSITSDDNGGSVMQRVRHLKDVRAFIHPFEDVKMKVVKGETNNETKMIKAIQSAIRANADGEIGTQTMSDLACIVGANCFPLTLKIYDAPVIIANDIIPFPGKGAALKAYSNCINGSFYASSMPCSINVYDSFTTQRYACHAEYGKPETVIYKLRTTGEVGIKRVVSVDELPAGIKWAVGGLGLLDFYDPKAEGFCKLTLNGKTVDFSDVLRKTNHTVLGVKHNKFYLVYCQNMTAATVNSFANKLGLEKAIMLDGGSVAGINGSESFAKINTSTKQYYIIQGVK